MARQFDTLTNQIYAKLGKLYSDTSTVSKHSKERSLEDQFRDIERLDRRASISTFGQSSITNPRVIDRYTGHLTTRFNSLTSSLSPPKLPPAYRVTSTHKRSLDLDVIQSGGFAEKPRKHVQSPIKFDKQAARGELKLSEYDASENRFVTINHSPVSFSKVRRATAPNIKKYLGRTDTTKLNSLPPYDAKYNFVHKNSKQCVGFEKRIGRNNIFSVPINDLTYEGIKYDIVSPRVLSSKIDKTLSRPEDKILPAFMLKVGFRLGLNSLTDKSLEMNNYCESDFQAKLSIFGKLESLPAKSKEER